MYYIENSDRRFTNRIQIKFGQKIHIKQNSHTQSSDREFRQTKFINKARIGVIEGSQA